MGSVLDQEITGKYAIYNGDCLEVMSSLPDGSVHLSVYSPPFGGLYHYTSSERDLSNCRSYEEFFEQYGYVVGEISRLTMPGRITAVHCMDVPTGNTGRDSLTDFPGDIIRLHARYNPVGLTEYAGERTPPVDVLRYRGWTGNQIENRYSHWIWRQYASAFWDDVRLDRVLPFRESRDDEDERHVHPLQLDVIQRCLTLWSNSGEVVLTPFMGVGSEVHEAVRMGRHGIGIELKPSYYRQTVKNLRSVGETDSPPEEITSLFDEAIP
jgi:hypothetical protein